MTEGQLKYQTLIENQRHNIEMEKYNAEQAQSSRIQAKASEQQAKLKEREIAIDEAMLPYEQEYRTAQTTYQNVYAQERIKENQRLMGFGILSFILPDANTALSSGAKVMSSLMG